MREFAELVQIMARLRGEDGCPWDRQQTASSLKTYLLEEVYEVLEAVDAGDVKRLCSELGDVMLVIVFFAQLASEAGQFDIRQSLRCINDKLRYRHPHVFGDLQVADAQEVVFNWEQLKRREPDTQDRTSALDGVPRSLPALHRASDLQKRAARVGFDWDSPQGAWDKISEEQAELHQATERQDADTIGDEVGDLLFAVVNYARLLGVDSEDALRRATNRFERRFREVEQRAAERGQSLGEMTLPQMDELWEEVKAGGVDKS